MIGLRLRVPPDQFDYVFGLLAGEGGLRGDETEFMATGGAEFLVTEAAWDRLNLDTQQAIARWALPGSEIVIAPPVGGDEARPASRGPSAGPSLDDQPPRAGTGSGKAPWAAYAAELAEARGVAFDPTDMSRDDIIHFVDSVEEREQ